MLLDVMRKGSNSIFGKILISTILLASVLGLALGYNTAFRAGGGDTVATVAGQAITAQSFDRQVRNILNANHLDIKTAVATGGIQKILASQVDHILFDKAAYDLGLQADEAEVRKELKRELAPLVESGKSERDILDAQLREMNMTEAELAQQLQGQIAEQILEKAVISGSTLVSDEEAADLVRYAEDQRTIKYVFLPDSAITDYKTPSDAMLKPFYDVGKERYAVPENRRFSLAVIKPDSQTVAISDADLQKAYQEDIAKYQEPERRRMTQAVLKNKAEGQAVADKVKAGASLEAAVKTVTGKTAAYLGTQDFAKDGLAPEIATPAFAAAKGAVIGPVQTALGWHVLQLEDILPPVTKPFDSVKDDLRAEVQKNAASDALYTRATKIDDALSGGASLEDIAKQDGLAVQKFGPIQADGNGPDGQPVLKDMAEDAPAIVKAVFQTEEGEAAPSIELKGGGYVVVRVDNVTPKSYKPFAAVRDDLAKLWIGDQQNVLNGDKAHEAVNALDAKGLTIEQLAATNHVQVETATFKRDGNPPAPLTPTALQKFMELNKGQHAGASAPGGFIVGEVEAAALPPKPSADDIDKIKDREQGATAQRYEAEYLSYLRTKYGVKTDDALLAKMYGGGTPADAQTPAP